MIESTFGGERSFLESSSLSRHPVLPACEGGLGCRIYGLDQGFGFGFRIMGFGFRVSG
jgi:hypothetical protein